MIKNLFNKISIMFIRDLVVWIDFCRRGDRVKVFYSKLGIRKINIIVS